VALPQEIIFRFSNTLSGNQILKKAGDTEEQTTARGTEETVFVSIPLAFVCLLCT
jgi:hypothetical protein